MISAPIRRCQEIPVNLRHYLARDVGDRPLGTILHVPGLPCEEHLDVFDKPTPLGRCPLLGFLKLLVQQLVTLGGPFHLVLRFTRVIRPSTAGTEAGMPGD